MSQTSLEERMAAYDARVAKVARANDFDAIATALRRLKRLQALYGDEVIEDRSGITGADLSLLINRLDVTADIVAIRSARMEDMDLEIEARRRADAARAHA